MLIDLSLEIKFQTTRSGGKGGQNVNKVETAVIASFDIDASALLTAEQKETVKEKLSNRISKEGLLQVKSQEYRTQLENKSEAQEKINELVAQALKKEEAKNRIKAFEGIERKKAGMEKEKRGYKINPSKIQARRVVKLY